MLRILLARHGMTTANQEDRFIGVTDPPLNDEGLVQAEALAARLEREGLTAIYSSPQLRARQTAQAVSGACGLTMQFEPDLRESDFGCWEGLTLTEIRARYPEQMRRWWASSAVDPAPHGGETLGQVSQRAREAYKRIVARHEDEAVLIVAHGGVLAALLSGVLGASLRTRWCYRFKAAALSELQVLDGQAVLVSLNDSCHLCP